MSCFSVPISPMKDDKKMVMERGGLDHFLLLLLPPLCRQLLFLLVLILSLMPTFLQSCSEFDRDSLLAFYNNVSFSSSPPLNWSSSIDCCRWDGIRCEVAVNGHDRVTHLLLPSRGLKGVIFQNFTNLTYLTHLNLSRNSLSGSLPSEFFSSLNNLKVLDLSYNRFHGPLSSVSDNNSVFQTVDLSSNLLEGEFPSSLFEPSVASGSLNSFNVSNNSFSGSIPVSAFCTGTGTSQLRLLDFSSNKFIGEIPPEIKGCSKLETFRAGLNNLSGQIPDELYGIVSLEHISLPVNRLAGPIGDGVVQLSKLRILELYSNQLNGSIPEDIGKLASLEKLLLYINNFTGFMPSSLMKCTNLSTLNLRVNSLVGNLSGFDFSALQRLAVLDLGNNNFTGEIPLSLYTCKSLTAIRLAANRLKGQVLPEILDLKSLSFLSISNNTLTNITGALNILKNCKTLTTLVLSKNFMNEAMPEDESISDPDGFQNIQVLALGGCLLSGRVPTWLAKLKKLQVLDLSVNLITGTIPSWFDSLPSLFYVDLSSNLISGEFPKELCGLPALTSGLSDQVNRSYLELPMFVMPNNATNQQYNQLSNIPPAIYLGNNSLRGNIPEEIGQLKFLHVLELNNNNLSGSIPDEISNLTNLERLDLSRNHLTGEIPASLKGLHFLSYFSVAYNDLQGPVPSGGQFDTFSSSSFDGNPGLCGPPAVQRSCSQPPPPTHRKTSNKKLLIAVVVGTCFGAGFIVTMLLALWILSTRRILPRGDSDKIDFDTISSNSNVTIAPDIDKDASVVILFPNNTKEIKDLSLPEILKATDNFNQANIIGCGGFGLVYKATLANGTKLAIKKLSGDLGLMEREFKAEVEALSSAQHENVVSLQGYCVHDGCRLLIYSYMENGSLDFWLHEKPDGPSQLDWPTRLKILQGASLGLAYMHQICEPHIVHRDIKSSNILLNEKFEAHVADFGLSRLLLPYQTHVTTELVGTLGYIPPEYGQAWVATLRGDMYSFGVVMLELITGKRPVEVFKPRVSRELVVWVQQMRNEGKQDEVFDPLLRGKGFEEEMIQVLDVACMCVNQNPLKRPTIKEVVDWLKNVGTTRQHQNMDQ
ncbi:Tyrosine-sulfated glycopeptide receptor 1 [Morus notabilis]|uniref:non-specific serine/threonine protein kinase n=1 Tax=Morus notabilis TaxID=981085 RepID=W9R257_9ROSA|nr:tyrosine-sulfated glycopeptide receptor 1 [Morus notabilis]EXB64642.1 Tyrosine-sulfated glycopeptide receptor 1 [Morus notabilis]